MIIGYARVSGLSQALQFQIDKLREKCCEQISQEKITGTKKERPEFQKVLEALQPGDHSWSRSPTGLPEAQRMIHLVKELNTCGVNVHVLNMGLVENTWTVAYFWQF
ncbi:recombinase family protein [Neobacillus endophyticus]|uniref:recombinase family protein n=1 Tax=Neobacillus endophyticus TaxID=2738405 RepID=UPI001FE664DF|nr:recombinase family protein [Neobacillus endophyticus]